MVDLILSLLFSLMTMGPLSDVSQNSDTTLVESATMDQAAIDGIRREIQTLR